MSMERMPYPGREGLAMISVVIPHAGPLEPLKRCIESLRGATLIREIEGEIIVVADKPDEAVRNYLAKEKDVGAHINDRFLGTEAALNMGWRRARGEYLMYLMSDVVLTPGALDALKEALETHPEFGWVALSSEHTGFLAGCSMFTRAVWEQVGAWDEMFASGGGFSDDDFLRRAWKAGYKPHIVTRPKVRHEEVTATTVLLGAEEKAERFRKNQALFQSKHGESGTNWDTIPRYEPPPAVHRIDWIKSKLSLQDTVLEVGVAENPVFKGTPFKVTTVDISRRPEEDCLPDIVADAAAIPVADKSYDVVNLGELLEHVPDPQAVLKEAVRIARKKVLITCPNEHLWPKSLKPFWNPGHVRFYDHKTFEEEMGKLGLPFKVEDIRFGPWRHLGAEIICDGGQKIEEKPKQVKLNLGSFVDTIGSGWTNVDILNVRQHIPKEHLFRQWDLRQGIPYPDGSVHAIRCSHLIEHLTLEEAKALLREMFRVLIPGGIARIATPDARVVIRHFINNDMGFFNAVEQPGEYIQSNLQCEKLSMLLYSLDYSHKGVYDYDMLRAYLIEAGFREDRVFRSVPGFSHSEAIQQETHDQHEPISLFVEAIKQ